MADTINLADVDTLAEQAFADLAKAYDMKPDNHAGIMKRALAIALIASRNADGDGFIHIARRDGETIREVIIPQRY